VEIILPPALEIIGLTVGYGDTPILSNVTATIPRAAQVAVVGPNGAGKSTLFKALVGLLPVTSGKLLLYGRPLGGQIKRIAYVPQRAEIDWRFPVTVLDVVLMGRYGHLGWFRRPGPKEKDLAMGCLRELGIEQLAYRPIGELSGGQQQRVFFARALAQQPDLLVLDEPFSGVDTPTQEAALELLADLRGRGITVMLSTHDLPLASARFDHLMLLNRRLVAFGPPGETINTTTLSAAFGSQLIFYRENGEVMALADCCCPYGDARRSIVAGDRAR
jgi:ABC-type Mn2+/Zn2+ transport system ATPase subunit